MNWDVFVSYANEDRRFARRLASELRDSGLRVWFDKFALEAGDSLRRTIDKGLRESKYGVVILSPNFFRKEWPQRELDGFSARDDGKQKVIIPVWYKVSPEEVRAFSPSLADKLSVNYSGSVKDVVSRLLRAIQRDQFAGFKWKPHFTDTSSGIELSVLPLQPFEGIVLCAGRFPVTNREYEEFVKATGHRPPHGERFLDGAWVGPFSPWEDPKFSSSETPVVCVDFRDAIAFCEWASSAKASVFLPTAELWDYLASEGQFGTSIRRVLTVIDKTKIHDRSTGPSKIARSGGRDNSLGLSDLFGNVWEWCGGNDFEQHIEFPSRISVGRGRRRMDAELRGGGFLDDMNSVHPAVRSNMLEDGTSTRHCDLGFRVCAAIQTNELNSGLLAILETLPSVPPRLAVLARSPHEFYSEHRYEGGAYVGSGHA
jgi:hypothetical protein